MEEKVKGKEQLTRRIDFRLSEKKHRELSALAGRTRGVKTVSGLLRKLLEDGKIQVEHYDNSFDKLFEELAVIQKDLKAIGVNINQVTRFFHSAQTPEARIVQVLELTKIFQQADLRLSALFEIMAKISEQCLPK